VMMRTSASAMRRWTFLLVRSADADMPEAAQVAQGDRAEAIDFVAADAVVDRRCLVEWLGFDECVEDGHRCLPIEGAGAV
jgi:hypothetical protein